jgi:ABC-type metal ion transport system substrate-binding protein
VGIDAEQLTRVLDQVDAAGVLTPVATAAGLPATVAGLAAF